MNNNHCVKQELETITHCTDVCMLLFVRSANLHINL